MSSDRPKRYELKARAESQQRTRERIVAATEELHREVGPARTTIADIARRAGVQRLTVYNNFPQLGDLFAACQGRFLAGHPPPDLSPPAALAESLARLYGWYRANQAMVGNVQRDRHLVPELDALLSQTNDPRFDASAQAYAGVMATDPERRSAVAALVRVALEFRTWQVLAGGGALDRDIAALLANAASCAGA